MASRLDALRGPASHSWYRLCANADNGRELPPPSAEDSTLLARVEQGDDSALELLFARWEGPLVAYFHRVGCPSSVVDELTEEVLVLVYRRRQRYDPARPFAPWIYGIARLVWKDYLRSRGRHAHATAPLEAAEDVAADEPGPLDAADGREALRVVHAALQSLDDDLREVFVLRTIKGLQYKQIAETLRIPIGTVKWRLHEAIRRLASIPRLRRGGWSTDDVRGGAGDAD